MHCWAPHPEGQPQPHMQHDTAPYAFNAQPPWCTVPLKQPCKGVRPRQMLPFTHPPGEIWPTPAPRGTKGLGPRETNCMGEQVEPQNGWRSGEEEGKQE